MSRILAAALCLPILAAAPAAAQDTDPPSGSLSVTGGAEVVSDYRFRGLSLSGGDVAVQPTVTLTHDSGFYLGAWGSNIEDSPAFGEVEVDFYGGYATEIAPGTRLDAGLTYYWYPDGDRAFGPSDYTEGQLRLSHTLGPVEARAMAAYAWDQAALGGDDSFHFNLALSAGIPATPVTLSAAAGYSDGGLAALAPGGNYFDWSLGASAVFGPLTAGVEYVDTDIPTTGVKAIDKFYDAGLVFSIGAFF